MQGIIIFAAVNAAFLIFIFFFFKARIDRRLRSNETLQVVREEISELIVELNQTTNRNVEIIEERIERLKEITQRADKRIGLLTKEIGNKEKESEVYTSLKPKKGVPARERTETEGADGAYQNANSSDGGSGRASVNEGAQGDSDQGGSGAADTRGGNLRPGAAEGTASRNPDRVPSREVRKESTRERVLGMYNNGISPDVIGKELDITLAEVELIISLNRNRGAVG